MNATIISPLTLVGCWFSLNCARSQKHHHPAYAIFATSNVQFFRRTQLPLSLALAFCLRTRVADMPAASSKVKKISGTSAFLRRKCSAKSESTTPVSTPSNNQVCEFDSFIPGRDKILSTEVSALANSFLLNSSLSESIWYVGFCEG